MSAPPVPPPTNDREHLKLLAIFHYVCGGFMGAFALFNAVSFLVTQTRVRQFEAKMRADGFPDFHGFDSGFPLVVYIYPTILAIIAAFLLIAARLLQRRHGYRFIYIVACLECLGFPFGTVLGVFTIVVLLRPSVKQLFGGNVKL